MDVNAAYTAEPKANQNHKSPQISPYMDEVYGQKNRSGDRQRCVLSPKADSHVIKRRQRYDKKHHDEQALMTGEIQRPPCMASRRITAKEKNSLSLPGAIENSTAFL